jgi:hypothetical protein
MMSPVAVVLVVFGRGVRCTDGRYGLTPASTARVRAAVEYVAAHEAVFADAPGHGRAPRIVFTGGWAEASEGADPPPAGCREGDLMLGMARTAGLDRYAELCAETRSRSTLENLLNTTGDGLLAGCAFSAREPLGIVSHPWHLPRVRFLAGKVLRLRGPALLDVPAAGSDAPTGWHSERAIHVATRLCLVGARGSADLLRRERAMVASMRHAERLAVRRPVGPR